MKKRIQKVPKTTQKKFPPRKKKEKLTIKDQILRFWETDKIILKYEENIKNLEKKAKLSDKRVIQAVQKDEPLLKIKILQDKRKLADSHLKKYIQKRDNYVNLKIKEIKSKKKKRKK